MKVVAILQSRMTSTRLPGKALVDIAGKPLTEWIIDRMKRCRRIDETVLAIPDEPSDDPLESRARGLCRVYRGSLQDVLARFHGAAAAAGAEVVIRLTGDNPLLDPALLDAAVAGFMDLSVDYAGTADCPLGIGAEIFTRAALERAHREAKETYQREHVTPYFYDTPGRFRTGALDVRDHLYSLTRGKVRLTVDTPEDLDVVRRIFERLLPVNPDFGLREISNLYASEPEMFQKNLHVRQKGFKETE
ncbi:glycosyltransferase family protein [bacterium]|nr:glycosyltransferase family protein [bacterium]